MDTRHRFVFRHADDPSKQYYYGCKVWPDSCVVGFPIKRTDFAPAPLVTYDIDFGHLDQVSDAMLAVYDLSNVVATPVRWLSWAKQETLCACLAEPPSVAIRPCECGPEEVMFTLLCRNAFYDMARADIVALAKKHGIIVPPGSSLFDTLYFVIQDWGGGGRGGGAGGPR